MLIELSVGVIATLERSLLDWDLTEALLGVKKLLLLAASDVLLSLVLGDEEEEEVMKPLKLLYFVRLFLENSALSVCSSGKESAPTCFENFGDAG